MHLNNKRGDFMLISHRGFLAASTAMSLALLAAPVAAYAQATYQFNLPVQPLADSLREVGSRTGVNVAFDPADVRGKTAPALSGAYSARDALTRLTASSGLGLRVTSGGAFLVEASAPQAQAAPVAATENDNSVSEVTVSGMRRSMRDALEVKRRETGVMEVISSKDIGVLPDVTIAESIARLPGVNTTRDRGNDSQAAIRGIGPRMVLGTVNGREVASSEPDRNVRWEIYPSEIVSGVSVYKSSQASLIAGGISGTVDLQTIRPLEYSGPQLVARGGLVQYDGGSALPGYDGLGYRASGAFVKKLTPDFAVVLALTAQRQKNGYESFQGWGYNDNSIRPSDATGPIVAGGPIVPTPWGAQAEAKFLTSDRYSASTGFQWRPTDNFEVTYDLLYSKFKIDEHQNQQTYNDWGNWAGGMVGKFTNPVLIEGDLVGATTAFDNVTSIVAQYTEDKDLLVTGLNGRWTSDLWTIRGDVSFSQAERSNLWQAARVRYQPTSMTWYLAGDDPFVTVSEEPNTVAQSVNQTNGEAGPGRIKDALGAAAVDMRRDFSGDFLSSIDFGARFARRTKYEATAGPVQAFALPGVTTLPTSFFRSYKFKNFNLPTMLDADFDTFVTAAYGAGALDYDPETIAFNSTVREDVMEAYIQGNYETTLFGKTTDGNFGFRAVNVDSLSNGESLSGGAWFQDVNGNWAFYPLVSTIATGGTDYTKILPSVTARIELGDGVYLKLGASRVMSRPPLNELKANRSISPIAPFSGNSGNPFLEPFMATQLDVSYEWYFDEDSLFAVAGYYKKIDNYIGWRQRSETINGNPYTLVSPVNSDDSGYIAGVEFTFQAPFKFIPGFENFGIYSNLALVDSDIEELIPTAEPMMMNGIAKATGTFDIWYARDGFEARLGTKYHSPYTALLGWNGSSLSRVESETTLDFSASYNVNEHVQVRFQAGNLLDTRQRTYNDNLEHRLGRLDYYGRRFLLDVTVKY